MSRKLNGRSFLRETDLSPENYRWDVRRPWVRADWGEEELAREAHLSWPQFHPWSFSNLHQLWERRGKDFINRSSVSNASDNIHHWLNDRAERIICLLVKLNVPCLSTSIYWNVPFPSDCHRLSYPHLFLFALFSSCALSLLSALFYTFNSPLLYII